MFGEVSTRREAWRVPVGAWADEAAWVIGGGPSFNPADAPRIAGRGRIIATNSAYRVFPEADVCLFVDRKWWDWQAGVPEWRQFGGRIISAHSRETYPDRRISYMGQVSPEVPLSLDPGALAGRNSGAMGLNLAFLYGCNPIYLVGFDMQPNGNWHDWHLVGGRQTQYAVSFIPALEAMGREVLARGVRVINCCKTSAVDVFPKANLGDALT